MNRLKLTFLLTIITLSSFACSCDWGGNFLKSGVFGELVFKGYVVERMYHLANGEEYDKNECGNWKNKRTLYQEKTIDLDV